VGYLTQGPDPETWLASLDAAHGAIKTHVPLSDGRVWFGDGTQSLPLLGGTLPGAYSDYAALAGNLWDNSVVMACLGWMMDTIVQAKWSVVDGDEEPEAVPNHAFTTYMAKPCKYYPEEALRQVTALSYKTDGNAYWVKERRGHDTKGPVESVRWIAPWLMEPKGSATEWISHYEYTVNGFKHRVESVNVVHFRDGLDPVNNRKGLARLKSGLRSIVGVNEADTYTAALLTNMGIPAVIFSPATPGDMLDEPTGNRLLDQFYARTGGANRGRGFATSIPVKADPIGLSPEDLALDRIVSRPTQQICSLLRISPLVVGLEDDRGTYENTSQARKAAWEDCICPMGKVFARTLTDQLLPDFERPNTDRRVYWDDSDVPALQESEAERSAQATTVFMGGLAFFNESRTRIGLDPVPGGDDLLYLNGTLVSFAKVVERANESDGPMDDPQDELELRMLDRQQRMDERRLRMERLGGRANGPSVNGSTNGTDEDENEEP
jgi:HK97 family phage portal protein